MDSCCAGSPKELKLLAKPVTASSMPVQNSKAALDFIKIPAGSFLMGSEDLDANPLDAEGPIRSVTLEEFQISSTPVTNAQFAEFVSATRYQTEAELSGWSFVFQLLLAEDAEVIGQSQTAPWWFGVQGANWKAPIGAGSSYQELLDHPVVHISYRDAQEFCSWSNTKLPTEAQWEKAARGGLESNRFPWGNELLVSGSWQCNIFQGDFPTTNTQEDGHLGTSPVASFPPNGFGGFDFAGNVWEWTSTDFFENPQNQNERELKVTRGGSYLCHDSYCNRYRVGARNRTPLDSIAGNIGFRVVKGRA